MASILSQVKNIVVVMLENRSLDNMCGWLYSNQGPQPSLYLPKQNPAAYNGLNSSLWNPSNVSYFAGDPAVKVPVVNGASSFTIPNPDPEETFPNVNYQLFGPEPPSTNPKWPNLGFVVNYEYATASTANQIMQCYNTAEVPVISSLAQNFAISDAWYSSVPTQTWPNRSFFHAGTSNGNVNNGEVPDPFDWDVPNIFNVLESISIDWRVYSDTIITPSLTRTMFPSLWDPFLDDHFAGFDDFQDDCANNSLPPYSFIEPSFLFEPNDEHPPHDVTAGEQFLYKIWQAVSSSPGYNNILLIITYDEHGGCYDHVMPPWNAAIPDAASDPGESGFTFNRFGVRVPMIVVSPYVQAGTVFRSDSQAGTPYDHTSVLATLRDWLNIPADKMLPSARIAAAPNLAQVLTRTTPAPIPVITPPVKTAAAHLPLHLPLNDLQMSLVTASARRFGQHPATTIKSIVSRQHAVDFFTKRKTRKNHY